MVRKALQTAGGVPCFGLLEGEILSAGVELAYSGGGVDNLTPDDRYTLCGYAWMVLVSIS